MASSGGASQLSSTVHLSQTLWSVSLFRKHWKARVLFSGWLPSSYIWLEPSDQNQGPTKVRPNTIIIGELHEPCGFFKQYITTEKLLLCFSCLCRCPSCNLGVPSSQPFFLDCHSNTAVSLWASVLAVLYILSALTAPAASVQSPVQPVP